MATLATRVLSSSGAMLIIRFSQRGLGLISTLVLARLLTPDDFGLVAIVTIVIQLFDVVATTGSAQYIIQKSELDGDDLNTAWTIDIIMKAGLQVVLVLSAPLVSDYYEKPELVTAIWVASFSLPITALLNPGLILLKKSLNYWPILKLSIIQKMISFLTVISIALIHPSYWAMIIGDLVSAAGFTIGSYIIHSYKPALNLNRIKTQWSFSQWILLKSIFGYTRSQIDTVLVSSYFSIADVGKYHLTKHLSSIPAKDIISPSIEPLLSAFSITKAKRPENLSQNLRISIASISFFVVPLCFFIWHYPKEIIDPLLGDKWSDTHGILSAFTFLIFSMSINQLLESYCISQGKVRQVFFYDVLSMAWIIVILTAIDYDQLEEFALYRSLAGFLLSFIFLFYVNSFAKINIIKLMFLSAPPFIISSFMLIIVDAVSPYLYSQKLIYLVLISLIYFSLYFIVSFAVFIYLYPNNSDIKIVINFIKENLTSTLIKRQKRRDF